KFGPEGVRLLLGEGRKDESGDFTKGAGLDETAIGTVIAFTAGEVAGDNGLIVEGRGELDQIRALVTAAGYGDDRIRIDPSVVRGLEYYTGPVYEVELLLDTRDDKGRPVRFGSV
ncbi:UNVERIFIED_CONTAM: histidine--tRNA ligase, partial [Bacteroidetes bacterium 56_B9]